MRCFIGIDLSMDAIKEIQKIQEKLKPNFNGRLTSGENLHLTLKFLGEIESGVINDVKKRLSSIKHHPFELTLKDVGVFSQKFIKIIWVKVSEVPLQLLIDNCLNEIFELENRFMGHITIARVKSLADKNSFLQLINKTRVNEISFMIRDIYLKESIFTKDGPIYKDIDRYKLSS
jgi:2'-5' RNA ligase